VKNEPNPEKDGGDEKKNAVGGVPSEEREPLHCELHLATCSEGERRAIRFIVFGSGMSARILLLSRRKGVFAKVFLAVDYQLTVKLALALGSLAQLSGGELLAVRRKDKRLDKVGSHEAKRREARR